jgi:hypothetical protein
VDHGGRAASVPDARVLLDRVLAANDGYGTLETVHRVALEIMLGRHRSEKRLFRGALAIRRPGCFRLTILGPMGVKMCDLLYAEGRTKVAYLAPELSRASRFPEIIDSIAADIAAIYRLDPQPSVTSRHMEETVTLASQRAPLYELKELRERELVRQMTIFAATMAVARSEVSDGQGGLRTITYGDYETDGKVLVPRSIHVSKEGKIFYWLSIEVESVALDQKLDEHIFVAE